jgi:hypothetical protein
MEKVERVERIKEEKKEKYNVMGLINDEEVYCI